MGNYNQTVNNGTTVVSVSISGVVSTLSAPKRGFELCEARVHCASSASGNFTITLDSGVSASFDTVIDTKDMGGLTDYVYQPNREHVFFPGDIVTASFTNATSVATGIELVWETC